MPKLVNIPDFMKIEIDNISLSWSMVLKLLIKSRVVAFIFKHTHGKIFCSFINLIYSKNGKIYFDGKYYYKLINDKNFYFPNKRIMRVAIEPLTHLNNFFNTYSLDFIDLKDDDLIVDCGANVGELKLSCKIAGLKIKYIGIEPDNNVFKCLEKNKDPEDLVFNYALSNINGNEDLFIDTKGGNTSLSDFGSENKTRVPTHRLDSLGFKKIKLLKIDAEGFEPEVLEGCTGILTEIQYISVDYGFERGLSSESTMVEVLNKLYENKFLLINENPERKVGLFKNTLI
jgi:FkbM family methyltransferase